MRKIVQIIFISFFLLMATVSYGEEIYKVQKGDTLYSISKRYNVPIQELMAVNNLDSIA
ncbi:MAG TPA: LysM peptidoglycan-binding domain-containing protein, partial [Nitrospirae bacterium]|nr:LysM peptidoglycan-binding domain-containing protein [Nitrospirota bacterium]